MPITKYYMINQLDQKTLDYINLNKISKIRFNHLFNKDISSINNCPSITHIIFGNNFNKSLNKLNLNLIFLYFGDQFNQAINILFTKLKYLYFSLNFNNTILPQPNLKVLKLGNFYNKYTEFNNFKELKYLTLGSQFNQPIYELPSKLEYLKLGRGFNNTLPIILPNSIKKLIINRFYKKKLNIPYNIEYLKLGFKYNHKIDFSLYKNLERLQLSQCYSHSIDNITFKIKELELGFAQSIITNISHFINLKKLTIYNDYIISYIPKTIEDLSIKILDNRKINLVHFTKLKILKIFILINDFIFDNIFDYLPLNLQVVYISCSGLINIKDIQLVSNVNIINKYIYCDIYTI
jgi:hypothetical protein